jgi:AraC-like DNA-binding protein/mannose-6-phosphate isomerase-like protein (cupin superfamily)
MITESANKIFEIEIEELSSWGKRPHKHNFFEIVYVDQGRGVQCINQHEFTYKAGHVFLLPPLDCHSFKVQEPSRFYYIRFTDHYFMNDDGLTQHRDWFDRIAYILANYNKIPGDIIASEREREFIINNIKSIYQEYAAPDTYSDAIISGTVASILNILARSIEKRYVERANEVAHRFGEILRYINTHLTDREKIRVPALAKQFSISKTYFSEYFKKQAGQSLANYVTQAKLRLVETKVLHTDQSLKEIAYELNFTDSSHLARTFKKVYGITIGEFKKVDGKRYLLSA